MIKSIDGIIKGPVTQLTPSKSVGDYVRTRRIAKQVVAEDTHEMKINQSLLLHRVEQHEAIVDLRIWRLENKVDTVDRKHTKLTTILLQLTAAVLIGAFFAFIGAV